MRFENRTFTDEPITLDGNEFVSCVFRRCNVMYSAIGSVVLDGNEFDGCTWGFTGPAASTIDFLARLYSMGGGAQTLIEATFENIRNTKQKGRPRTH
jgi:hypothetical protein